MAKQQETRAPAPEYPPTSVHVRIHSLQMDGNVLARASADINGVFAVRGISVMQGNSGPFVSMPARKVNDQYQSICFPCTSEFKQQFDRAVLDAYRQELAQVQSLHQEQEQGGMSMSM